MPIADVSVMQVQDAVVAALENSPTLIALAAAQVPPRTVGQMIKIGLTEEAAADFSNSFPLVEVGQPKANAPRVSFDTLQGTCFVLLRFWDLVDELEDSDHRTVTDFADQVSQEAREFETIAGCVLSVDVDTPARAAIWKNDGQPDKSWVYVDVMLELDYVR